MSNVGKLTKKQCDYKAAFTKLCIHLDHNGCDYMIVDAEVGDIWEPIRLTSLNAKKAKAISILNKFTDEELDALGLNRRDILDDLGII